MWISFIITLFVISVVFWIVAKAEGRIKDDSFKDWSVYSSSLWYCYGTLVGEAITRDTKSSKANALRYMMKYYFREDIELGQTLYEIKIE